MAECNRVGERSLTILPQFQDFLSHQMQQTRVASQLNFDLPAQNYSFTMRWWHDRLIAPIQCLDGRIETIRDNCLQKNLDAIGNYIQDKFAPLAKYNDWLNTSEAEAWYKQLALFLVKLPMQSVRNIIRLLYTIIKEASCSVVHPLKAIAKTANALVDLLYELSKPETWSKIGAGLIGATLGQGLITGNPFSIIGLGVGAAMMIGGLTMGALRAALEAEKSCALRAARQNVWCQAQALPESFITSFFMGLIAGGIQRAIMARAPNPIDVHDAEKFADEFLKKNGILAKYTTSLGEHGEIRIQFLDTEEMRKVFGLNSEYSITDCEMTFSSSGARIHAHIMDDVWGNHYNGGAGFERSMPVGSFSAAKPVFSTPVCIVGGACALGPRE